MDSTAMPTCLGVPPRLSHRASCSCLLTCWASGPTSAQSHTQREAIQSPRVPRKSPKAHLEDAPPAPFPRALNSGDLSLGASGAGPGLFFQNFLLPLFTYVPSPQRCVPHWISSQAPPPLFVLFSFQNVLPYPTNSHSFFKAQLKCPISRKTVTLAG